MFSKLYLFIVFTLGILTVTSANSIEKKVEHKNTIERKALFGELHVHSSNSFDAGRKGNIFDPELAYKFAKGDAIPFGSKTVRISQPLDFMAVTDHAMYLGVLPAVWKPGHPIAELPIAEDMRKPESEVPFLKFWSILFPKTEAERKIPIDVMNATVKETWSVYPELAKKYYEPGVFTTIVGYEWTSAFNKQGLHRNILFRGTDVPSMPFSSLDSKNPEDLWAWMDGVRKTGSQLLAIPHNPNQSNGLMFSKTKWDGSPVDAEWAETRMRNEPLVEITQIKGTSETAPILSPNDEWAGFEIMDERMGTNGVRSIPVGSYVRQAYKDGIQLQKSSNFNPYKFGVIGSTDGHNSVTPAEENNYTGKMFGHDETPEKRRNGGSGIARHNWMLSASGLAGVWAGENTREEVYDALARKEVFATSGPRIQVRLFAGWDFPQNMMSNSNWSDVGYSQGVPMGSDMLDKPKQAKAPQFAVWAMKDPSSAWLQRLQIVKGWSDAKGETHEQVYDVSCADGKKPNPKTHRCPANDVIVNINTCELSHDSGNVVLTTLWKDNNFDAEQNAFYYARVIENPTCRWSTWEANRMGLPLVKGVAPLIQERAWSSPIWYEP